MNDELDKAIKQLENKLNIDTFFVTLAKIGPIKFEIRTKEQGHNVPHFHVKSSEYECSVSINDFKMLAGNFPPQKIMDIITWGRTNKELLIGEWNRLHPELAIEI